MGMAKGRSSGFPPQKGGGKTYRLDVPPNVLRAPVRPYSPGRTVVAFSRAIDEDVPHGMRNALSWGQVQ